jgi:hypothetical protein
MWRAEYQIEAIYRASSENGSDILELMRRVYENRKSLSDFQLELQTTFPLRNYKGARQQAFRALIDEKLRTILTDALVFESECLETIVQKATETFLARFKDLQQKVSVIDNAISCNNEHYVHIIFTSLVKFVSDHLVTIEDVSAQSVKDEAVGTRSTLSSRAREVEFLNVYQENVEKVLSAWANAVLFAPGGAAQQLISKQQTEFGDSLSLQDN